MKNPTQLERYKKLLSFIDAHFKEDINIKKVEEVCHYSYRNINRIFEALHHETIGKYIKRLRLEKAAQYLKYSEMEVSDIAHEVGFEDRTSFSKAFKNKYKNSPSAFRKNSESDWEDMQESLLKKDGVKREKLSFEIEYLPDFKTLFIEYRGPYDDRKSIDETWEKLMSYATNKDLISDTSILMTEIVDDEEISDHIRSRYYFSLVLEQPLTFKPEGLFRTKSHQRQKYVKFTFKGSDKENADFYRQIYTFWMQDVGLEMVDLPTLEFYPNYEEGIPEKEVITEIYIPVK